MLTELTKEQEALIPIVRDEWIAKVCDPEKRLKLDKVKAKKQIEWFYEFCGEKKPLIWFMDSPFGCQIAANFLRLSSGSNIKSNIESNIKSNVWSNIWSNIKSNIKSNIESNIKSNVWSNIGSNIWSNIKSNI